MPEKKTHIPRWQLPIITEMVENGKVLVCDCCDRQLLEGEYLYNGYCADFDR